MICDSGVAQCLLQETCANSVPSSRQRHPPSSSHQFHPPSTFISGRNKSLCYVTGQEKIETGVVDLNV